MRRLAGEQDPPLGGPQNAAPAALRPAESAAAEGETNADFIQDVRDDHDRRLSPTWSRMPLALATCMEFAAERSLSGAHPDELNVWSWPQATGPFDQPQSPRPAGWHWQFSGNPSASGPQYSVGYH
jgi:hypothetical protein